VVPAVDREATGAGEGREPARRVDLDLVGQRVARLPHLVGNCRGTLAGQILVERRADGHPEHLDAPADGQRRQAVAEGKAGQSELALVELAVGRAQLRVRRFAIPPGLDVRAARQQEPVVAEQEAPQPRFVRERFGRRPGALRAGSDLAKGLAVGGQVAVEPIRASDEDSWTQPDSPPDAASPTPAG
jgi:hypothetical protein